jgi:nucleoside-diphosphate-sugar epimerase
MVVQLENDTTLQRDAASRDNTARVCVTGATGYLAGHIVQRLLEKGYTVHATCRNPHNEKSVAHLKSLPQAGKLLRLFKADLCVPGSFDDAVAGCTYVIHTASPYAIKQPPKGKVRQDLLQQVNKLHMTFAVSHH